MGAGELPVLAAGFRRWMRYDSACWDGVLADE